MGLLEKNVRINVVSKVPADAEAVVVLLHKDTAADRFKSSVLGRDELDAVSALLRAKIVSGKSNELTIQLLESAGKKPRRLIVIGLGNAKQFSAECLREAGGALAKAARKHKLKSIAVILPETPATLPGIPDGEPAGPGREIAAAAIAEGLLLGLFHFGLFKGSASAKDSENPVSPSISIVVEADIKGLQAAVDRASVICEGQNFARTIASRPANDINPLTLAKVAQEMSKEVGLSYRVLDEKQMKKLGMGGILAVGAGSIATPPRMIVMEWKGGGKKKSESPLLVVGKAITFDTGGISIKPADKMGKMIFDKCGAMAVMGLMYAAAKLKLPVHVVGIMSSAENHISSRAYRPGDILRMYNGVTVEVTNTDAEGRLVLGDALAWGIETYKPSAVVDLATLTGGVIMALGKTMAGVMGNDDALIAQLNRAAGRAGEKIWRLPLDESHREMMKSDPADLLNSGGREAHATQGAAFLSYFVKYEGKDKIPWAHLDIAGVADTEKEMPFYEKGATGWGVRMLVEWVSKEAKL